MAEASSRRRVPSDNYSSPGTVHVDRRMRDSEGLQAYNNSDVGLEPRYGSEPLMHNNVGGQGKITTFDPHDPHNGKAVLLSHPVGGVYWNEQKVPAGPPSYHTDSLQGKRPWYRRKRFLIPLVVTLILVVIVIPVAVTQALRRARLDDDIPGWGQINPNRNGTSDNNATSSADERAALQANSDILLGTRLSTLDPRTGGDVFLFYQAADGDIQYIEMSNERVWQGNRSVGVSNARNNTPIATTYSINQDGSWNLFYVDTADTIRYVYTYSDHNQWQAGAFFGEPYIADASADTTFAAIPGVRYNSTENWIDGGFTLFACTRSGGVLEMYWEESSWSWLTNGEVGGLGGGCGSAAATSKEGSGLLYKLGDGHDDVELWYYDYADPPDDVMWRAGPASPMAAPPNGNICAYYTVFAYLAEDGSIRGNGLDFGEMNNPSGYRWGNDYAISDEEGMMENTALACWHYFPRRENSIQHIFYQMANGTLREAVGYPVSSGSTEPGTWEYLDVFPR